VWDPDSRDAVVIDPVLDYDEAASVTFTESVDAVLGFVADQRLRPHCVLETHAHADHLSGSQRFKEGCPAVSIAIGRRITRVQATFKELFHLAEDFPTDGSQFDCSSTRGGPCAWARSPSKPVHARPHPRVRDSPDRRRALHRRRAVHARLGHRSLRLPGGSAADLYASITQRIYAEPDATRIFVGHDYQPGGRELRYETTVGEQKAAQRGAARDTTREQFIAFREARDATLSAPKLLFQSIQVNIDAGRLPRPEGLLSYLKIPVNAFSRRARRGAAGRRLRPGAAGARQG
jgi:glyoxylase-like metal-dependent hydrolase (beta-lactamase superfamily II)